MKYEYWKSSTNNQWYWRLKANNGQIVATGGEGYVNQADCLRGIALTKASGEAPVVKLG